MVSASYVNRRVNINTLWAKISEFNVKAGFKYGVSKGLCAVTEFIYMTASSFKRIKCVYACFSVCVSLCVCCVCCVCVCMCVWKYQSIYLCLVISVLEKFCQILLSELILNWRLCYIWDFVGVYDFVLLGCYCV